jgi:acyl-CoA thioesterase-1
VRSRFSALRALAAAAFTLLASAPAPLRAADGPVADEGVVVAVGDSLTAGLGLDERDAWPAQLERLLRAEGYRWKVVNAGVSGETSSGARARLEWVLRLKPDVVVLATGANDGLRGLPPALLRENLQAMLALLQARGVTVVVAGMRMLRNLGAPYAAAFAAVYPEVARERGAILVPFLLEGVGGVPALNLPDGIHPSAAGQRVIAGTVRPHVLEAIARVRQARGRPR